MCTVTCKMYFLLHNSRLLLRDPCSCAFVTNDLQLELGLLITVTRDILLLLHDPPLRFSCESTSDVCDICVHLWLLVLVASGSIAALRFPTRIC